jgi:hypothetical protein
VSEVNRNSANLELANLESKFRLVRDRVDGIFQRFHTGLYLYGAGGLSKSHTVLKHLDDTQANYRLFNSRMTAKGLCLELQDSPDALHVLEDMERITKDADAQGVLRSALWAQPGKRRMVTWTTATERIKFEFRGGIIMIANTPLAEMAELKALSTRIDVIKLEVTDGELVALMRDLANRGYQDPKGELSPSVCLEVVDYLIDQCRQAKFPLDMRLYVNALADYLQWQAKHSRCGWRELVTNRVHQSAAHRLEEAAIMNREQTLEWEREQVRQIMAETDHLSGKTKTAEEVKRFKDRTGLAPATFYRRKREVVAEEARREEDNGDI